MEQKKQAAGTENIYRLDGRVPLQKAIPFGLQHVLAMFVANLAPVLIVCSAVVVRGTGEHLNPAEITGLLQCAMFTAGLGTCMQLYPVWKIGSKLPIVMGISFTFVGSLLTIGTNPALGYEGMVGAVILGGRGYRDRAFPFVGRHGFVGRRDRRRRFRRLVPSAGRRLYAGRLSGRKLPAERDL